MSLAEVAGRLYSVPLAQFVARRTEFVTEVRANGEPGAKDLANQIGKLKKPSVAAWVVNQLVRAEPAQIDQMLAVGAALREATESLDGGQLRALASQRRQLTAALTALARDVAAERGVAVTAAVADQVSATLTAGIVNPSAALALQTGLLTGALTATGPEPLDLRDLVAVPQACGPLPVSIDAPRPSPDPDGAPDAAAQERERAAQARLLAEYRQGVVAAELALASARREHAAALDEHGRAQARSLQVNARLDELRRLIAEAETEADEATGVWMAAEDVLAQRAAEVERRSGEHQAAQSALASVQDTQDD